MTEKKKYYLLEWIKNPKMYLKTDFVFPQIPGYKDGLMYVSSPEDAIYDNLNVSLKISEIKIIESDNQEFVDILQNRIKILRTRPPKYKDKLKKLERILEEIK